MTTQEALSTYIPAEFRTSEGDNLNRVCWKLYRSLDPRLMDSLVRLNPRNDWNNLKPNTLIKYFTSQLMLQICSPE